MLVSADPALCRSKVVPIINHGLDLDYQTLLAPMR